MYIAKQYEDYLEKFVFDTVATIATKLFGKRVQEPANKKTTEVHDQENSATDAVEVVNTNTENDAIEEVNSLMICEKENEDDLEKSEDHREINSVNKSEDADNDTKEQDEELEKLLNEAITKQYEVLKEKQDKRKQERKEYDSTHEGLIGVHFHMTLFLLMCVLTILFIPTTISWAKDFRYSNSLSPDPSIIPATIVLSCVFVLWQLSAPKNLYAYNFVASILYVSAAICVIYCQDSVYRLSGVISAAFIIVTAHQLYSPKRTDNTDIDPAEAELINRIQKMKAVLADAEANSKKTT